MEPDYGTSNLYLGAAIEMIAGAEPSLCRNTQGLLQLNFPRTPEVLGVVEDWDNGLKVEARSFADKINRNFRMARSWRGGGA
jgi:hypothetical protein